MHVYVCECRHTRESQDNLGVCSCLLPCLRQVSFCSLLYILQTHTTTGGFTQTLGIRTQVLIWQVLYPLNFLLSHFLISFGTGYPAGPAGLELTLLLRMALCFLPCCHHCNTLPVPSSAFTYMNMKGLFM